MSTSGEMPTSGALQECADWLVYCLRIGWSRSQLDALETLWWQYHDRNGRLIAAKEGDGG